MLKSRIVLNVIKIVAVEIRDVSKFYLIFKYRSGMVRCAKSTTFTTNLFFHKFFKFITYQLLMWSLFLKQRQIKSQIIN